MDHRVTGTGRNRGRTQGARRRAAGTRAVVSVLAVIVIAACGSLPRSGPSVSTIRTESNFVLLPITEDQVRLQEARTSRGTIGRLDTFGGSQRAGVRVGDTVGVTIFEASEGGLFTAQPAQETGAAQAGSSSIPAQTVDAEGMIFIPYAGWVHVADKPVPDAAKAIAAALRGVAVDPQVVLTVGSGRASSATVLGAVGQSGLVGLSPAGSRVLDVLAQAGGVTLGVSETAIRLVRADRSQSVPLATILQEPAQNIRVEPSDTIFVEPLQDTYAVLGGTNAQNEFAIDRARLTLAEALGRAGGLNDNRANRKGVFIFRYEPRPYLGRIADVTRFVEQDRIPVIYQLRVDDPQAYHLMQRFVILDDDVIYVANAPTAEFSKFLNILNSSVNTVSSPLLIGATLSN